MSEDKTRVFLRDCMEGLREYPDKYFDLAIVDPPYGIGATSMTLGNSIVRKKEAKNIEDWDNDSPELAYFHELRRVSKNQIIWGLNHFVEKFPKNSSCWIVWYKNRNNNDFADCELAWTSFDSPVRIYQFDWNGFRQGPQDSREVKIHINQKPVMLYKWLLKQYAKPGDKILDSHLGSGSSRIAAYDLGFDFIGFERHPKYFADQEARFKQHISQLTLFTNGSTANSQPSL